jgi:hypothetical protein
MRHRFISIEEEGFENYLNRTAEKHNGKGYSAWRESNLIPHITVTQLALIFGVRRPTIYKWRKIDSVTSSRA